MIKKMQENRMFQVFSATLLALVLVLCGLGRTQAIQVSPRIFSPNGDGWNDKVVFQVDNPALLPLKGEVFDMTGAKVGDMSPGPQPDTSLVWDGKGRQSGIPGGIYIYHIELGNELITGTILLVQ